LLPSLLFMIFNNLLRQFGQIGLVCGKDSHLNRIFFQELFPAFHFNLFFVPQKGFTFQSGLGDFPQNNDNQTGN